MNQLNILPEKNLGTLLQHLEPVLNDGAYVFCFINEAKEVSVEHALAFFREREGITLVLPKQYADEHQLTYGGIFSWITFSVHSSLEAVGLTAAFSTALADSGISCNVIAAFHHDHIFVAQKDAAPAMQTLQKLSTGATPVL